MAGATSSITIGCAGEYYVLFRLLSLGYVAVLAPDKYPATDIIVTDPQIKRSLRIQVKTRQQKGSDGGWHMKKKHEEDKEEESNNLFYFFVNLPQCDEKSKALTNLPDLYIIPSHKIASVLQKSHQVWLKIPGKKGDHKDHDMRRLLPDYSKTLKSEDPLVIPFIKEHSMGWLNAYRENWGLIDQALS